MSVTTVYLVRHGRTTLNAEGRFRGRQDPPLDAVGIEDARSAAAWLASTSLAAVYTSPLRRARETARAIAAEHEFAPRIAPEAIDLDHGAWTGLTSEEAEELSPTEFARFRSDPLSSTPPGGEPLRGVADRLSVWARSLGRSHPDAAAAVVSHEIPIRLLLATLLGLRGAEPWGLPLPTGSITELRATPDRMEVTALPFAPERAG